jgi:hypothetical protein
MPGAQRGLIYGRFGPAEPHEAAPRRDRAKAVDAPERERWPEAPLAAGYACSSRRILRTPDIRAGIRTGATANRR